MPCDRKQGKSGAMAEHWNTMQTSPYKYKTEGEEAAVWASLQISQVKFDQ